MLIPHITFHYSSIYDTNWKEVYGLHYKMRLQENNNASYYYPTPGKISKYIDQVTHLWNKEEKEILEELSLFTTLPWKEEEITCYIVGRAFPFSDPLTLPIFTTSQ